MRERLLSLLRGHKVVFHLVEGSTSLVDPSLYPFKVDEVPLQCIGCPTPSIEAYTSGNRSIVQPSTEGLWFKAKAIGIPEGSSRPLYVDGRIYTYYLSDTHLGTGRVIWGLSTIEEAKNEIARIVEARGLGLPVPRPIGIGFYKNVHVLEFKDRGELFTVLQKTLEETLLDRFKDSSQPVQAACIFMDQPTDVRVDEILYGFLHPSVDDLLSPRDIKDFLKWLGSSCGYNLRTHHDADLLHGTIPKNGGFMTNSHTANHLVDEKGTYMTDYHMAYRSKDKDLKRVESFFLASVMNPLPRADEAAAMSFGYGRPEPYVLSIEDLSLIRNYDDLLFKPNNLQEEFTDAFINGIGYGYNRRKTIHIETKLRREALLKAAACKKELFQLLGLPEGMQRGVEYVAKLLTMRNFTEEELKASLKRIDKDLPQSIDEESKRMRPLFNQRIYAFLLLSKHYLFLPTQNIKLST